MATMTLPSSAALIDKTKGFCPEALSYRDDQFEKKVVAAGMLAECQEMLQLLKNQTEQAFAAAAHSIDVWGKPQELSEAPDVRDIKVKEEKRESAQLIDQITSACEKAGMLSLQVDIAVSHQAAVLVGYDPGALQDANIITQLEADFNTPAYSTLFNECLFCCGTLLSQDGVIYQSESRSPNDILKNSDGKALPATRDQIESGLAFMQQELNKRGIGCNFDYYDYEQVQASLTQAAQSVSEESLSALTGPSGHGAAPDL
jgi:hypothetical protein